MKRTERKHLLPSRLARLNKFVALNAGGNFDKTVTRTEALLVLESLTEGRWNTVKWVIANFLRSKRSEYRAFCFHVWNRKVLRLSEEKIDAKLEGAK